MQKMGPKDFETNVLLPCRTARAYPKPFRPFAADRHVTRLRIVAWRFLCLKLAPLCCLIITTFFLKAGAQRDITTTSSAQSQALALPMAAMLKSRRSFQRILALAAGLAFLIFWNVTSFGTSRDKPHQSPGEALLSSLPCRNLPGANDTLVIIRTGSTELEDRFTIHLSTSLKCYPHYLIFSDYEEDYYGEHILDALDSVSPDIRANHKDFELWRRLQQDGRAALDPSELSGSPKAFASMSGNAENPGWKLDKWKFLPMLNRTYYEYPDMKWYVFIEADTSLLWTMLLQYLAALDHTKPIYAGSQMFIADVLFAHGGSGFIVSQPGMRLGVEHYATKQAEVEAFTDGHWAGDCVLGKYIREAGVPFHNAWPHIQGDYPGLVPYARADGRSVPDENLREWCYPALSYHHMSPDMTQDLYDFEQKWMKTHDPVCHTITMLNEHTD